MLNARNRNGNNNSNTKMKLLLAVIEHLLRVQRLLDDHEKRILEALPDG